MALSLPTTKSRLPDDELVSRIMTHVTELMANADDDERREISDRAVHALQGARWGYWFLRSRRLLPLAAVLFLVGLPMCAAPAAIALFGSGLIFLAAVYAIAVWTFLTCWHGNERSSKIFISTNDLLRYDPRHRQRLQEELKGLGERLLAP